MATLPLSRPQLLGFVPVALTKVGAVLPVIVTGG